MGEGTFVTFEVDGATEGILTVEAVAEGIAPTAENLAANNSCTVVVEGLRTQGFTLSGTVSKEETVSVVAQVQNATTQSESYSLCFAAYDEGGRMVDVCYVTGCETEAGGQTLRQATFAAPVEKIRTVRIFALNGTAPLTAAAEYTL